jgi:hypothetical protein
MPTRTVQFALLALVSCIASVAAVAYAITFINAQRAALETQVTQIAETESQQAAYIQLSRIADDTADERATLAAYFLRNQFDSQTILLLNDIEEVWGPTMGVVVEPGAFEPVPGEPHPWFELNYQITGSPAAVRDMLALLVAMPYHAQIDSITIRQNEDATESVADIRLRVALLELL